MKGNDFVIEEINKEGFRKGGDKDIKKYLFGILNEQGLEGLKNIQRYSKDYENVGYNFDKIQQETLYIWHGLNNYWSKS